MTRDCIITMRNADGTQALCQTGRGHFGSYGGGWSSDLVLDPLLLTYHEASRIISRLRKREKKYRGEYGYGVYNLQIRPRPVISSVNRQKMLDDRDREDAEYEEKMNLLYDEFI